MRNPIRSLRDQLGLADPADVLTERTEDTVAERYVRYRLEYRGLENDRISALFFAPRTTDSVAGIIAFHQHNGEFHLGKSEVAGDVGDPLQAFGPALASRGIAVLAPDAITFEDRRGSMKGTEPHRDDWLQHYNAMAYRLVDGDVLMRKCLDDAQRALSALIKQPEIDGSRVGVCGHSYGGTTALYLAALDKRCRFACVSGAGASFKARKRAGTGLNMFELVPGIAATLDTENLVNAILPRPLFLVSATHDPYSVGVERVVKQIGSESLFGLHVEGPHALDQARQEAMVNWLVREAEAL